MIKKWKEFESLIAKIQAETAPDAVVQTNNFIVGKSGRKRQLDVTLSRKVGLYPVLIVIECKRYSKPVGIERVEAFVTKLRDVGASQGVMISNKGFTRGAKAVAKEHLIALLSYREAEETDWRSIVGSESWIKLIFSGIEKLTAIAVLGEDAALTLIPDQSLYDEDRNIFCRVDDVLNQVANEAKSFNIVGPIMLDAQVDSPLFLNLNGVLKQVIKLSFTGIKRAWEFTINLCLASGHVLEDVLKDRQVYKEVVTEGFDWAEIPRTQGGRELTQEDYNAILQSGNSRIADVDLTNAKRYLRLVVIQKEN